MTQWKKLEIMSWILTACIHSVSYSWNVYMVVLNIAEQTCYPVKLNYYSKPQILDYCFQLVIRLHCSLFRMKQCIADLLVQEKITPQNDQSNSCNTLRHQTKGYTIYMLMSLELVNYAYLQYCNHQPQKLYIPYLLKMH